MAVVEQLTPVWVVIVVLVVTVAACKLRVCCGGRETPAVSAFQLPPGPPGLPVIGNLHLLMKGQKKQGRHRVLADLAHTYGDIMYLRLGSVPTVVASSAEAARLFLKTYDAVFASRPYMGMVEQVFYDGRDAIFAPYGEFWRQARKLCVLHFLTAQKVQSFGGLREEETAAMAKELWRGSGGGVKAVDIVFGFRPFPFNVVWRALAGKTFPELTERLMRLLAELSLFIALPLVGDFVPWLRWFDLPNIRWMKQAFSDFDNFAQNLLERFKKQDLVDDTTFVGTLLKLSRKDPSVTEQIIKALILDMFLGGTETISSSLEWATAMLLRHPPCLQRLQKEIDKVVGRDRQIQEADVWKIKYLHCVVKESMRLNVVSPLGLPHFSMEEVIARDFRLPKGTMLMVNYWAMNRDPAMWENPEEFMPERFMEDDVVDISGLSDFRSLPFGYGRRVCPGVTMALTSVLLALAKLFHTFDWIPKGHIDLEELNGNIVSKKNPIMAIPKLRLNIKLE